jgi:hypothetical protein
MTLERKQPLPPSADQFYHYCAVLQDTPKGKSRQHRQDSFVLRQENQENGESQDGNILWLRENAFLPQQAVNKTWLVNRFFPN